MITAPMHLSFNPLIMWQRLCTTCGICKPPALLLSLALSILVIDRLYTSWVFRLTVIKFLAWFGVMLALWPLWSQPFGYPWSRRLRTSARLWNLVIVFKEISWQWGSLSQLGFGHPLVGVMTCLVASSTMTSRGRSHDLSSCKHHHDFLWSGP